jgi:hypothetical protein
MAKNQVFFGDASDPGNNRQTGVVPMEETKTDGTQPKGITIKKQAFKEFNYDVDDDVEIDQLPFTFAAAGPATLRGRNSAYKVTITEEAE